MDYDALVSASGALDASSEACFERVLSMPLPASWSMLQIYGANLGSASAIWAPLVSIAPSDGGATLPCDLCSLTPGIALCVANTSSAYTRNGQLSYALGHFLVTTYLTLGVTLPPRLLSLARDSVPGVVAVPGPSSPGLSVGCALLLRFDKAVKPVGVGTRAAIDALLAFSSPLGTGYSGAWVSPSVLRIVIITAALGAPAPGTAVGLFRVSVLASGGLCSATGTSAPSSTTGLLEAGSWGDAVQSSSVVVRSSTALYVTVGTPSLSAYPTVLTSYSIDSYVMSWGASAAASGLGVMAVNVTAPVAASTSVTLPSLVPGVPVYFRVSVTVRIVAGSETLLCVGPFVPAAAAIAPLPPTLTSVVVAAGRQLGTRGGDAVVLSGVNIGLDASDLAVSYSNGNITLPGLGCVVTVAGAVITCSSSVGAGGGFAWRITVGAATSPPSPNTVSYESPVLAEFSGAGAVQALTQGGQHIIITGDQFGPTGSELITSVQCALRARAVAGMAAAACA